MCFGCGALPHLGPETGEEKDAGTRSDSRIENPSVQELVDFATDLLVLAVVDELAQAMLRKAGG